MIRSMTGYGAAETPLGGQKLCSQIQSVNHRFAEVSVRLPRSLAQFENQIRHLLSQNLGRGKITYTAIWEGREDVSRRMRIDVERARQYQDDIRRMKAALKLNGDLDLATVLALPDVMVGDTSTLKDEETWTTLERVTRDAIVDLQKMRTQEGEALRAEFERRLSRIESLVSQAEERAARRPNEAKERMLTRLKPLLGEVEVDPIRLAQEVAFLAERMDATEECVRLHAHIVQFRGLISDPEPAGRKINFLLQEMNREVNTLGSKANDLDLGVLVIDLKDELEKVREQVQNVE